jgi:hypothetical protein
MRMLSVGGFLSFWEATPLPSQYFGVYKALIVNVLGKSSKAREKHRIEVRRI